MQTIDQVNNANESVMKAGLNLGDVSQGKFVTIDNLFELFYGILNPKQIEGPRLLLMPFSQQQFNQTSVCKNTGTAWTLRRCAS